MFPRTDDIGTMMRGFEKYLTAGVKMQQANEGWLREFLKELPLEKRLEGLSPEERLEGLSPQELLEGIRPYDILQALPPEFRQALPKKVEKTTLEPDIPARQG